MSRRRAVQRLAVLVEPAVKKNNANVITVAPRDSGHLYLLREREFIRMGEEVYKVGRSTNIRNRMPHYPKDSCVQLIVRVEDNLVPLESSVIHRFRAHFVHRVDIGQEYFQGDVRQMERMLFEATR